MAKYKSRELTEYLKRVAVEAHDWSEESGAISKSEALARILWNKALGSKEVKVNDKGEEREITNKPESWAIQLIYDRLEGKSPMAIPDDEGKLTAADKVREMTKERANALVDDE
jgi:hypothetical protein